MRFKQKFISSILTLGLVASSLFVSSANNQQLEVHHINVGQGESIYIELPDGTDVLIDAGKSNYGSTVVNYLNSQEKGMNVDYLIATHPDADHVGGMQDVFKSMKVNNFIYPTDAPHTTQTWQNVLSLAKSEGCSIKNSTPGTTFNLGGAVVKFIQPTKDYSDNNDDSVVTYIDYKDAEFLLTGDIEATVEKDMVAQGLVPNVDFMSIPHHGSKGSSTSEFVTKADPEYAIVSVGQNSYGHPTADALNKYSAIGSTIYRTDKVGNVVIKTDGNTATINGTKVDIGGTATPPPVVNDWKNHWANKNIEKAMNDGWIDKADKFRPDDSMTRAEFVKVLNRAFKLTTTSGKVFDDTKTHWAKNEIDIAVTNGVCGGVSANKFNPDGAITRQEAAKMVVAYKNVADSNHDKLNAYSDKNLVDSWALDYVEGAIEKGYMQGSNGKFNPTGKITRAEAVTTIGRIN